MVLEQIAIIDTAIVFAVNSLRSPLMDLFFSAITWLGSIYFIFFLGLALLYKNKKAGANFLSGFLVNLAFIILLKQIIFRPRPFEILPGIIPLDNENSSSFPSGHAADAFFSATFLSKVYKKFSPVFYGAAVLVAFSRIYVGVHYPTDVLFGAIEGFIFARVWMKNFDVEKVFRKLFSPKGR